MIWLILFLASFFEPVPGPGHGQKDRSQRHGSELDVARLAKNLPDLRAGALLIKAALDELYRRGGSLSLHQRSGKLWRQRSRRRQSELNLAKTVRQHGHLLRKEQRSLVQVAHMAGKVLDFRQVVRRDEDCGFGGAFQHALDQLITNQRVQAAE